ncbi:phosphatidylserine decarboxylase-domain-containing protein [Phycomyces nitens]|nr:phosphatidylserine decarboxylase-domain-containing protein [Phycomyces nitens]
MELPPTSELPNTRKERLLRRIQGSRSWRAAHAAAAMASSSLHSRDSDSDDEPENPENLIDPSRLVLRVMVTNAVDIRPYGDDTILANPYAIVSCAGQRHQTHVVQQSADPDWSCTFDLPLVDKEFGRKQQHLLWSNGLVVTVCDKVRFRSTYLGQVQLPVEHLFEPKDVLGFDDAGNETRWYPLHSTPLRHHRFSVRLHTGLLDAQRRQGNEAWIGLKIGLVVLDQPASEPLDPLVLQETWELFLALNPLSPTQPKASLPPKKSVKEELEALAISYREKPLVKSLKNRLERATGKAVDFDASTVGVVFMEIMHANDLPPIANSAHTRFDMDPFVITSYGTSTFRTQAVQHNLNPVWNEKLFFHVRDNESTFRLKFSIYDQDKFSTNDLVASQELPIADIIKLCTSDAIQPDPNQIMDTDMQQHTVSLNLVDPSDEWAHLNPSLTIRVKFVTEMSIRKTFWTTLAKTYDADGNTTLSKMEVTTMLESLGSTLSESTINAFWGHHSKDLDEDLTVDELVDSLEGFVLLTDRSSHQDVHGLEDGYEYPDHHTTPETDVLQEATGIQYVADSESSLLNEDLKSEEEQEKEEQEQEHGVNEEKVIHISKCPICHRPNMSAHGQMDILTHVATCSANDWTSVDRFLMGDFVTEAYAQRKWFVKLAAKVGYGTYSPGASNANIIVQDRASGQLVEERMSVYVRVGMRLMYKGMKTSVQSKTAQRIMHTMSIKQGERYNAPQSASEIEAFVKFHQLDLGEMKESLSSFKTFNEFFYRELKPGSRPCDSADDSCVAVSAADCRLMVFATIDDATRLWIKGIDFGIPKLLNDAQRAKAYDGGALAIFRLAPQDYHRYHSPVDGVITDISYIEGQYYTVNPMAIRTTLDVYGENVRCVVQMKSEQFGNVTVVCIGAMMVGSIVLTAKVGDRLNRTDPLGYFAFGGSTIVVLWEKGRIVFDNDLLENSAKALETLVRVGNHIGRC